MNSNSNTHEVKSRLAGKNNHVNQFFHKAGVEVGAWVLTGGFSVSIVWLVGNIF